MTITKIQKRNGSIEEFSANKIEMAIWRAAQSVGGTNQEQAQAIASDVTKYLNEHYTHQLLTVELVLDCVEKILIEQGHAKTAKSFIIYREKHNEIREDQKESILDKIKNHQAVISLTNGDTTEFDINKIYESVKSAAHGLEHVDIEAIVVDACKNLYSGVSIAEIERAVINSARAKIEIHNDYSFAAAQLLLQGVYKTVFGHSVYESEGELEKNYNDYTAEYIKKGIDFEQLNPELADFDLEAIAEAIKPERDRLFGYMGIQTLADRYLIRTPGNEHIIYELPQLLWMRVAMGLALNEKPEDRTKYAIEFYNTMSQFHYISGTPTLFNSGTTHPQLSSCFLNTVPDSLSGIFKTISDNAMLSKFAGGLGTDWTPVRALGSQIKGTNGESQGTIPFLKIFNDTAIAVNQGGKRKGAMCAYMEVWHKDFEELIEAKKNTGDERRRLHDVHTAAWIPDLFMKRVREGGTWTLFSPDEVPDLHDTYGKAFEELYLQHEAANHHSAKQVDAKGLWRKMLTSLYETGHPWITFKDPCNVRSPQDHCGVVHSSNLCTEITLNTNEKETAVCNLGSINLEKMIVDGKLSEERIKETTTTAMRMLDNVIDINFYSIPETKYSNSLHRPIGLGMMGYQGALYMMDIPFESEANLDFADESMEMISYYAIQASSDLAKERGTYNSYAGSKWDRGIFPYDTMGMLEIERGDTIEWSKKTRMDWDGLKAKVKEQGMRNSNCMAIAPTATISLISGTTPCVEPIFRNIYVKENVGGSFIVVNQHLINDLIKLNLWNREMIDRIKYHDGSIAKIPEIPDYIRAKYKEAFEISPEWVLRAAGQRSKWIDQSASTNIFLETSSGKVLNDTYTLAWKLGLKTTYYLRSQGASSTEKMTVASEAKEVKEAPAPTMSATDLTAAMAGGDDSKDNAAPQLCRLDDPDCEACQ